MWFNYVLLYTLYVNEENGLFFCRTCKNSIREGLAAEWVRSRSGRWGKCSRQSVTNLDQAMWAAFSEAGDQRSEHRAALCIFFCVRGSSLLPRKTEQHGVKQRYSCEMATDLEVNG